MIIAFDIDGTVISNTNGLGQEKLNLNAAALMDLFHSMKNTRIIVWSGGGKEYAEQIINKYGLSDMVDDCYDKHTYDPTIYGKVDIAIDDEHAFALADKNLIVRMK